MKIICAGLSKTGTKSLAKALRILGFKVHDIDEHLLLHIDEYLPALSGEIPDFAAMYTDVDAVTDIPACLFWKEISESFPESKIVLMERDCAETWVESYIPTLDAVKAVLSKTLVVIGFRVTPYGRKLKRYFSLMDTKMRRGQFSLLAPQPVFGSSQVTAARGGYEQSKDAMKRHYFDHNARVKATVPRDKLLVYKVKEGWEPLCVFLGVDVPDVPFPHVNVQSELVGDVVQTFIDGGMMRELKILSVFLVMMLSALIYAIII